MPKYEILREPGTSICTNTKVSRNQVRHKRGAKSYAERLHWNVWETIRKEETRKIILRMGWPITWRDDSVRPLSGGQTSPGLRSLALISSFSGHLYRAILVESYELLSFVGERKPLELWFLYHLLTISFSVHLYRAILVESYELLSF